MHRFLVALSICGLAASAASAQQYSNSFGSADPAGAALFGSAAITGGSLRLTQDSANQSGAIVLPISAQNVSAFRATFLVSYSTTGFFAADGLSFNLGVIPDGVIPGASENGPGNGLTVALDNFDLDGDGNVEDGGFRVLRNGTVLAVAPLFFDQTTLGATPVDITLRLDGTLDVRFNGNLIVANLATGFVPQAGQRFGLAARTGGLSSEQRVDDLIVTPHYRHATCSAPQAIRGDGLFGYILGDGQFSSEASCVGSSQPVWFCWRAPLTGMAEIRTTGLATHDSVLSAYDGCAPCPQAFGQVACNDDFSGAQSRIVFPTTAGATYLIRVADFGGPTTDVGPHAFTIMSNESCRIDFNGDGNIDADDLSDYITLFFTGCP